MKQLPLQQDEDQLVRWNEDTLWSLVRAREKFSHSSNKKTVGQYSFALFVIALALRGAMMVIDDEYTNLCNLCFLLFLFISSLPFHLLLLACIMLTIPLL